MTVGIAYLDGPRLARSWYAASDWVSAGREEINHINVFPVADTLRALGDATLEDTARTMARGWAAPDNATEMQRVLNQSGTLLTMDRFDDLLRAGAA